MVLGSEEESSMYWFLKMKGAEAVSKMVSFVDLREMEKVKGAVEWRVRVRSELGSERK